MYGTVARMQLKPGLPEQLRQQKQQVEEFAAARVPSFVTTYNYRTDTDPAMHCMAVVFDSKDASWANARSPEQNARCQKVRALLTSDLELHDGEIVATVGR